MSIADLGLPGAGLVLIVGFASAAALLTRPDRELVGLAQPAGPGTIELVGQRIHPRHMPPAKLVGRRVVCRHLWRGSADCSPVDEVRP
jgi:hypothetical protein